MGVAGVNRFTFGPCRFKLKPLAEPVGMGTMGIRSAVTAFDRDARPLIISKGKPSPDKVTIASTLNDMLAAISFAWKRWVVTVIFNSHQ